MLLKQDTVADRLLSILKFGSNERIRKIPAMKAK